VCVCVQECADRERDLLQKLNVCVRKYEAQIKDVCV